MATLSLLLPLSLSSTLRPNRFFSRTHLPKLTQWSCVSSDILKSPRIGDKTLVFGGNSNQSQFSDENGVIDDMDSYLNNLSLEYDSVWDTKPSWCQPWTITLTGVLAIAFSWLILQSVVVTTLVSLLISSWWYVFLYSYPKTYADMIAERRKRVTNGVEDTYGSLRKTQ
ncbi:uncharacterized protein [Euphorbia lathyris]|uniref:uncharacterized protein n=1 Tax=Euphorbia lathyris TaxID=212925 RepID=UPI0033133F5A